MAVVNLESGQVTKLTASEKVNVRDSAGTVRNATAHVVTSPDDSVGSTYRMVRIPSRARVLDIQLWTGALGAGATLDVGVYEVPANGGALVDDGLFDDSIDVAALVTRSPAMTQLSFDDLAKSISEILLSASPSAVISPEYDIVLTVSSTVVNADDVALSVDYTVDG